jgi:Zn-dependent peptidase ImmA (M78 family)
MINKLTILGIEYSIDLVRGDYCRDNMGLTDFANAKIFINESLPVDVQENVLLHELLHVCYRNGYLSKDDDEERVVEVLTNILYPILKEALSRGYLNHIAKED